MAPRPTPENKSQTRKQSICLIEIEGFQGVSIFYLTFAMTYDTIKWINSVNNGAWRSPEARLNGVQEVAGSNPVAPIFDM